jgi:transposase InsO family protein
MATAIKKRGSIEICMGRPKKGVVLSSFQPEIINQLRIWRLEHPLWGPKTLHTELINCARYALIDIPCRSSIASWLQHSGFIKPYVKRLIASDVVNFPQPSRVHQRWQVDVKGNAQVQNVGFVGMVNVKDVFSCTYTGIFPLQLPTEQSHPTSDEYRLALRMAFIEHGLPEEIQCDHDGVFYDNQHESPFPTRLHLWFVALGLQVVFSRVRTPTDQGKVERQHRTVKGQVSRTSEYANWQNYYEYCQKRKFALNWQLPCESLGKIPPLKCYPGAIHSGRFYRPEQELDLLDLLKVDTFLTTLQWKRRVSAQKTVKIAKQVYSPKGAVCNSMLTITFDSFTRHFDFFDSNGLLLDHVKARGLEKNDLMGKPLELPQGFQLQIPFDVHTECLIQVYEARL